MTETKIGSCLETKEPRVSSFYVRVKTASPIDI